MWRHISFKEYEDACKNGLFISEKKNAMELLYTLPQFNLYPVTEKITEDFCGTKY